MSGKWYSLSLNQIRIDLDTDPDRGLGRKQVRARRQKRGGGENDIFAIQRQTYRSYLSHLLTDIPSILLWITVLIAVVFESRLTLFCALGILLIHLVSAVTGYVRAQRVLESVGERALPGCKVLREGKLYLIKQKHLVQGDIIFLSGGDIVPCDARLLESEEVEVLETNLTSVSGAVRKQADFVGYGDLPPSGQANMVFASTILTHGRAKAVVCEVGEDTLVCKMEKNKPIVMQDDLTVLSTLAKLSRGLSVALMVLIFLLTGANLFFSEKTVNLFDTFLTVLSLTVSSMSEYYMPFGFLIVSCGIYAAMRVKKHRQISAGAMIKNIGKLDALRRMDCLILPIDGMFTSQNQQIDLVYTDRDFFEADHTAFAKYATRIVRLALLSTGLYGADALKHNNLSGTNVYSPEEEAIIHTAEQLRLYNTDLETHYPMLDHRGIGALNDLETTIVHHGGENLSVVRGDVSRVLSICTHYCMDGRVYELDMKMRSEIEIAASAMAKRAYKVVAVASGNTEYTRIVRPGSVQVGMTFEGFLGIREPILEGSARSLQKCRENGIRVLLMADDENENHIAFARALGLISGRDQVITGREVSDMKEGIFRINTAQYNLYLGLTAHQKQILIQSLHDKGMTVGVLGYRLDEIALYREADVGFAQSITIAEGAGRFGVDMTSRSIPVFRRDSGHQMESCEALKYIADVVVSRADQSGDGGFHAVLQALICAKGVFRNLHRAVRYLITTQTARLGIVLCSLIAGLELMTPVQILFTGLIVDFLAVLVIAFAPSDLNLLGEQVTGVEREEKPVRLLMTHLPSVLIGLIWAILTVLLPLLLGIREAEAVSTVTFCAFVLCQGALLLCAKPMRRAFGPIRINRISLLAALIEVGGILLCATMPQVGYWFDCVPLSMPAMLGTGALTLLVASISLLWQWMLKRSSHR